MEFRDIVFDDGRPSGWRVKPWAIPENICDALMRALVPPREGGACPLGVKWAKGEHVIYGHDRSTPRLVAMVATDPRISYTFSGSTQPSQPMPDYLRELMAYVNAVVRLDYPDAPEFNTIYMNWYRDGEDHIGYHHDREEGKMPYVVTLTCHYAGATGDQLRRFVIQDQDQKSRTAEECLGLRSTRPVAQD